jgi:hypothetical protein
LPLRRNGRRGSGRVDFIAAHAGFQHLADHGIGDRLGDVSTETRYAECTEERKFGPSGLVSSEPGITPVARDGANPPCRWKSCGTAGGSEVSEESDSPSRPPPRGPHRSSAHSRLFSYSICSSSCLGRRRVSTAPFLTVTRISAEVLLDGRDVHGRPVSRRTSRPESVPELSAAPVLRGNRSFA